MMLVLVLLGLLGILALYTAEHYDDPEGTPAAILLALGLALVALWRPLVEDPRPPGPALAPTPCRFCDRPAVGVFFLSRGCVCYPRDRLQALCQQHVVRSNPTGSMVLHQDLTVGPEFSRWWEGKS